MTGRPSSYSEEIADRICEAIATTPQGIHAVCRGDGMPSVSMVYRWLNEHESFRERYARARECQADVMDECILAEAVACTPENAQAARVRIDAFKWRASKLAPKVYGDPQGGVVIDNRQYIIADRPMTLEDWSKTIDHEPAP